MKSILTQIGSLCGGFGRHVSYGLVLLFLVGLTLMVFHATFTPTPALAQEDGGDKWGPAPAGGDNDVGLNENPPANTDKKTGGDAPADKGEKASESLLVWMGKSLGWSYGLTFLVLSITFVSFLVTNILGLRRETVIPSDLVLNFEAELKEKRYQEAYQLAKGDESFLGQVLSAGLSKLQFGYDHAVEAMQEASEDENMRLEHRLSYISLIGNISPMIGLMGTVQGMIASFQTIAGSETTPPANELAAGISTALFTTLIGLMIAVPAIASYSILRNRASRLVLEAGMASEDLMGRFQTPAKRKRSAGGTNGGSTNVGGTNVGGEKE
ncbi:MAG: MotA/TolQ/ExbB proton channel family protein [Planctomycetia bacterium]|jgi:biopolymer transport protein ExbB